MNCRAPVLTPVIPATQEAETRKIAIQSQPRQIVKRPYLKNTHHKNGWWNGSRYRPRIQIPEQKKKSSGLLLSERSQSEKAPCCNVPSL
jgi:hypothetical protein